MYVAYPLLTNDFLQFSHVLTVANSTHLFLFISCSAGAEPAQRTLKISQVHCANLKMNTLIIRC